MRRRNSIKLKGNLKGRSEGGRVETRDIEDERIREFRCKTRQSNLFCLFTFLLLYLHFFIFPYSIPSLIPLRCYNHIKYCTMSTNTDSSNILSSALFSSLHCSIFYVTFCNVFITGVQPERLLDAFNVKHCALSLVGEPIMYPRINEMLHALHDRKISTFLVTNAQVNIDRTMENKLCEKKLMRNAVPPHQ